MGTSSCSSKKGGDQQGVQDLVAVVSRVELLSAACSGQFDLLNEFLRKDDAGEALAAPPPSVGAVAIDVELQVPSAPAMVVAAATEGEPSLLHVVAAASGDNEVYLKMADAICGRDMKMLVALDGNGDMPQHCAARAGNASMVRQLISLDKQRGGERRLVGMQNKRGETALHEAVRLGVDKGLAMVNMLMTEDKELARVVAMDGTSPLYLACSLSHYDIARELIKLDTQLAYSGPLEQNALYPAVVDNKDMTKLLLKTNKDLAKQRDLSRSTPMHFAASASDPFLEIFVFVFIERTLEFYSLGIYFAPHMWLYKFYQWLNHPLSQLVRTDRTSAFQPDSNGLFPVHVAASAGNLVAVIILLATWPGCAGLRDRQGMTFLHTAVVKKSNNIVKFVCLRRLFEPILNIQDNEGNTALHLAIREGHLDIFQSLIRNEHVRLNLPDKNGQTPMDISLSYVRSGFYFGLHARRRILGTLNFTGARVGNHRRDDFKEKFGGKLDSDGESKKITEFAQIVGIGSVLVATATFAAAFTMPGGFRSDVGTPMLAGKYAFNGFVLSNALAFMCSTIATFTLVFCGIAAVDVEKRIRLVSFALALLLGAARCFCGAFAFALFLLLEPVEKGTAIATCVMTALAVLDGLCFLWMIIVDTAVVLRRKRLIQVPKLLAAFVVNMVYLFWPYAVIFSLLGDPRTLA